jgi:hypothetical protein
VLTLADEKLIAPCFTVSSTFTEPLTSLYYQVCTPTWRTKHLTKVCYHDGREVGLEIEAYADVCIVQERLSQVEGHLMGGSGSPGGSDKKGRTSILEKKPDDVSTPSAKAVQKRSGIVPHVHHLYTR